MPKVGQQIKASELQRIQRTQGKLKNKYERFALDLAQMINE